MPIHVFLHLTDGCMMFCHSQWMVWCGLLLSCKICCVWSASCPNCLQFISFFLFLLVKICSVLRSNRLPSVRFQASSSILFVEKVHILMLEQFVSTPHGILLNWPSLQTKMSNLFDLYRLMWSLSHTLVFRDLSFNAFSGDLPRSFSLLTNLRYL